MKSMALALCLLAGNAYADCSIEQLQGNVRVNLTGERSDHAEFLQYRVVCTEQTRVEVVARVDGGNVDDVLPVTAFIEGASPNVPVTMIIGPDGSLVPVTVVVHGEGKLRARNEHNFTITTQLTY